MDPEELVQSPEQENCEETQRLSGRQTHIHTHTHTPWGEDEGRDWYGERREGWGRTEKTVDRENFKVMDWRQQAVQEAGPTDCPHCREKNPSLMRTDQYGEES